MIMIEFIFFGNKILCCASWPSAASPPQHDPASARGHAPARSRTRSASGCTASSALALISPASPYVMTKLQWLPLFAATSGDIAAAVARFAPWRAGRVTCLSPQSCASRHGARHGCHAGRVTAMSRAALDTRVMLGV